ncbi:hypothetical protein AIF0345_1724 [Actinomyces israelii]|nr:hypothetical protein AIF0345_1724 [Actinomyces israelii]
MTGDRHVRFCGSPGATAPGPPDFAQRVPVGARARACVHRGRQEATRSLLVCRCLKVSRSGCYAWLGREPSRTVRRRKELSALVEWVLNSSRTTLRAAAASHVAGARRGVETSPDTACTRPLGARQAAATPRGTRRHRPGLLGLGLASRPGPAEIHRQQAGRAGGWATPTYIITWEGFVYLATAPPRAAARGKQSGTRLGRQHAAPTPLCEAIDMAARRRPYTTGGRRYSTPTGAASTHPIRAARRAPGEL